MDLGRHKWRLGGIAVLTALTLGAAGCGSSSNGPGGATGGAKQKGGTVTWAELPSTYMNYIFPFMSLAYFSVSNSQDGQYLMYRPLYWFGGENQQPTLDPALSPADAPQYTNGGKTVVINMKGWKWSNGETVDANDVLFWLHMMSAEFANWAGGTPGHADANGLGRHLGRGQGGQRWLHDRHGGQPLRRLQGGLQLPGRPGQEHRQLRLQPTVERRGRAVEALVVRHLGQRRVRA
jgi:hypothetical protein